MTTAELFRVDKGAKPPTPFVTGFCSAHRCGYCPRIIRWSTKTAICCCPCHNPDPVAAGARETLLPPVSTRNPWPHTTEPACFWTTT